MKLTISALALFIALAACTGKRKDKRGFADKPKQPPSTGIAEPETTPEINPEDNQVNDEELIGKWIGECFPYPANPDTGFADADLAVIEISKEQGAKITIYSYAEIGECEAHGLVRAKAVQSNIKVGNRLSTGVVEIDFEVKKLFATPFNGEATNLNGEQTCGFTNWVDGVETEVTNLPCSEEDRTVEVGDKLFDIYKIEGDVLRFGIDTKDPGAQRDAGIGDSPDSRPTTLSDYKFTREQ